MENCLWDADIFEISDICADEINYRIPDLQASEYPGDMEPDVALAVCLNACGCVDMNYIGVLTGLTVSEAAVFLSGEVFQDPEIYDREHSEVSGWTLREQYLTGNLMQKLEVAKHMEKKYHRFGTNISALQMALPEPPDFDGVGFCLGSQWIPPEIYSMFCRELLRLNENPEIVYFEDLHVWKVIAPLDTIYSLENSCQYCIKQR